MDSHHPLAYMEQLGEHFKPDLDVILEVTEFVEIIYTPTPPLPSVLLGYFLLFFEARIRSTLSNSTPLIFLGTFTMHVNDAPHVCPLSFLPSPLPMTLSFSRPWPLIPMEITLDIITANPWLYTF